MSPEAYAAAVGPGATVPSSPVPSAEVPPTQYYNVSSGPDMANGRSLAEYLLAEARRDPGLGSAAMTSTPMRPCPQV